MREALLSRGIAVDDRWVVDAVKGTRGDAEAVYVQYLHSDIRSSGTRNLPDDVGEWRDGMLEGRRVLQLEAREDIGDESARKDSRTLKILLTDGAVDVQAFERRPIDGLIEADLGAKIFVSDIAVRHGLLLLEPSCARVLGGGVPVGSTERMTLEGPKRRREYVTLGDFECRPAPTSAECWAYVVQLKKYFWCKRDSRYVLVVSLEDDRTTMDAVFAEIELARLAEASSSYVFSLSDVDRKKNGQLLTRKLEQYEGLLKLEKKPPELSSSGRPQPHDGLPIILGCDTLSDDEKRHILKMKQRRSS